jgi:hypothetical protein
MKAIVFRYLFVAFAAVLFLIVAAGIFDVSAKMFEEKSLEHLRRFTKYKSYSFNINDLLVDPNDPTAFDSVKQNEYYTSGSDPTFCKDVRNCIEMNIKEGERCVIKYKVKPGTPFSIDSFKSALAACPPTTLKEEMYGNTQRKICDFKPITNYNEIREDNISIIDYEPSIHNCYLPDSLGSLNVLNDADSINYLYSGRGNQNGYSFENGGIVRIVVTNVSLKNDIYSTCSYSIYVCGQNSIGTRADETTVQVFKKIQNLDERELYYNETIVWGGRPESNRVDITLYLFWNGFLRPYILIITLGIIDIGTIAFPPLPTGYNVYGYYPRYYNFTFQSLVPNKEEALIDAVDAGMWEWNKINFNEKNSMKYFLDAYYPDIENIYFGYSPITLINEDNSISYGSDCWNTNYENSNIPERTTLGCESNACDIFIESPSLKHVFNFNNGFNAINRLKMILGIKKIFITNKPYYYEITGIIRGIIDAWNWNPLNPFKIPTEFTFKNLEYVKGKYKLDDFEPRVILVLDPITFCSEFSGPSTSVCGDNKKDVTERCDGNDLGTPPASCTSIGQGYVGGTLSCIPKGQPNECKFDTSSCIKVCGNNAKEGAEQCDGIDATACPGQCRADCTCPPLPACGNDILETGEECEPPLVINSIHCDQAWASCHYGNRRYGTRDGFGDCNNNCQCIEDSWDWGVVDGADYCANCPNHCDDKAQNCGEECDPGASPTGCDLGESCKADCTCVGCPDKCEADSEYRDGSFDGSSCIYNTIKKCNYDCKDAVDCIRGIWCGPAVAKCKVCATGNCGDVTVSFDGACYQEETVPLLLDSGTCVCTPGCPFGLGCNDAVIVSDCSYCNFYAPHGIECNCAGEGTGGCESEIGGCSCSLSECSENDSCTYE